MQRQILRLNGSETSGQAGREGNDAWRLRGAGKRRSREGKETERGGSRQRTSVRGKGKEAESGMVKGPYRVIAGLSSIYSRHIVVNLSTVTSWEQDKSCSNRRQQVTTSKEGKKYSPHRLQPSSISASNQRTDHETYNSTTRLPPFSLQDDRLHRSRCHGQGDGLAPPD